MIKLYLVYGLRAADSSKRLFGVNTSAALRLCVCNIRSVVAAVAFTIYIFANFYGKLFHIFFFNFAERKLFFSTLLYFIAKALTAELIHFF